MVFIGQQWYTNSFQKIICLLIAILFLNSCIGIRMPKTGSPPSGKYYNEFYTGDGIIQYYIKPLRFKSNKTKLKIDFTFKNYGQDTAKVITNLSLVTTDSTEVQSITLASGAESTFKTINVKKLFSENERKFHIRYTCTLPYASIKHFFNNMRQIKLETNSGEFTLEATSKSSRISKKINHNVFNLIK